MFATSDDFADYRAVKMAAEEGTRLSRADRYLRRHPRGAWADEVRGLFESEEPLWFEVAQNSRAVARDYVVDLPHGPHIQAARSLLVTFDARETDLDMLELLTAARRTDAQLDLESGQRRRVGEIVLEELAALVAPETIGSSLDDPPPALAAVLRGATPGTWGAAAPIGLRQDELHFLIPTPNASQARQASVTLRLRIDRKRVTGGTIEGENLFLRWAEADKLRVLDPAVAADREAAIGEVVSILQGALEARLPSSRCAVEPKRKSGEILERSCDGRRVVVRTGAAPGDSDVIEVRASRRSSVQGPPE